MKRQVNKQNFRIYGTLSKLGNQLHDLQEGHTVLIAATWDGDSALIFYP